MAAIEKEQQPHQEGRPRASNASNHSSWRTAGKHQLDAPAEGEALENQPPSAKGSLKSYGSGQHSGQHKEKKEGKKEASIVQYGWSRFKGGRFGNSMQ